MPLLLVAAAWLASACAVSRSQPVMRIALLAPFEGRYREIGYNALYAARLALLDSGLKNVELLPIDDGGAVESAESRARALSLDPQTQVALVVGYSASGERVQQAFGDMPVILVGNWSAKPVVDRAFALSSPRVAELMTVPSDLSVTEAARLEAPLVGGEVFALVQFPKLRGSLDGITIVSSARPPDAAFMERYRALDSFAPEPGLLATLTYDAASMAARALEEGGYSREGVRQAMTAMNYDGLNGLIQFENGYWADGPVRYYGYDSSRRLVALDHVVE